MQSSIKAMFGEPALLAEAEKLRAEVRRLSETEVGKEVTKLRKLLKESEVKASQMLAENSQLRTQLVCSKITLPASVAPMAASAGQAKTMDKAPLAAEACAEASQRAELMIADAEKKAADAEKKFADAEQMIADAQKMIANAEKKTADAEKKAADVEREVVSARQEGDSLAELQARLEQAQAETAAAHVEAARTAKELQAVAVELENSTVEAGRVSKELDMARQGDVGTRSRLANLQKEVVALQTDLETTTAQQRDAQAAAEAREEVNSQARTELQADNERLEKRLSGMQSRLEEAQEEVARATAALKQAEIAAERSATELAGMRDAAGVLETELGQERARVSELKGEAEEREEDMREMEEQLVQLRRAHEEALRKARDEAACKAEAMSALEHELDRAREAVFASETRASEARAAQEAAQARAQAAERECELVRARFDAVDARRMEVEEELLDARGAVRVIARVRPPLAFEAAAEERARQEYAAKLAKAPGASSRGSAVMVAANGERVIASAADVVAAEADEPLFQFPASEAAGEEKTLRLVKRKGRGVGGHGVAAKGSSFDFEFQRVLGPTSKQQDVFSEVRSAIHSAVDGKRVCVFAYGQTGAGKTHTMLGDTDASGDLDERGVIPRAVQAVFERAETLADHGWETTIKAELLEVYMDKVFDLLARVGLGEVEEEEEEAGAGPGARRGRPPPRHAKAAGKATTAAVAGSAADAGPRSDSAKRGKLASKGTPLDIRTDRQGGAFVHGQRRAGVSTEEEVFALLRATAAVRATAATAMNATSSRSHCIFTLRIHCVQTETGQRRDGVLNLIDLAGSERIGKSGSINDPELKKQAVSINGSLTALGQVLSAMGHNDKLARRPARGRSASTTSNGAASSGRKRSSSTSSAPDAAATAELAPPTASSRQATAGPARETHVPFRNSQLTRLLQPCLSDGARAIMIVNLNPNHSSCDESVSSLNFADAVARHCSTYA